MHEISLHTLNAEVNSILGLHTITELFSAFSFLDQVNCYGIFCKDGQSFFRRVWSIVIRTPNEKHLIRSRSFTNCVCVCVKCGVRRVRVIHALIDLNIKQIQRHVRNNVEHV